MKQKLTTLILLFALFGMPVQAQFNLKKLGKEIKQGAERQVERQVQNKAQKTVDDTLNPKETSSKPSSKQESTPVQENIAVQGETATETPAQASQAENKKLNKMGKPIPVYPGDFDEYAKYLPKIYSDIQPSIMGSKSVESYERMLPILKNQAYNTSTDSEQAREFVYMRVAECLAFGQATDNLTLINEARLFLDLLEKQYNVSPTDPYQLQWREEYKRVDRKNQDPISVFLDRMKTHGEKALAATDQTEAESQFFYASFAKEKVKRHPDFNPEDPVYVENSKELDQVFKALKAKGYNPYDDEKATAEAERREAEAEEARKVDPPTPKMRNAAMEATMLKLANAHFSGIKVEKVYIMSADWQIHRNALGAIIRRTLNTNIIVKENTGRYFLRDMSFEQPYTGGGKYGATQVYGVGLMNKSVRYK